MLLGSPTLVCMTKKQKLFCYPVLYTFMAYQRTEKRQKICMLKKVVFAVNLHFNNSIQAVTCLICAAARVLVSLTVPCGTMFSLSDKMLYEHFTERHWTFHMLKDTGPFIC